MASVYPFRCTICRKGFMYSSHLHYHKCCVTVSQEINSSLKENTERQTEDSHSANEKCFPHQTVLSSSSYNRIGYSLPPDSMLNNYMVTNNNYNHNIPFHQNDYLRNCPVKAETYYQEIVTCVALPSIPNSYVIAGNGYHENGLFVPVNNMHYWNSQNGNNAIVNYVPSYVVYDPPFKKANVYRKNRMLLPADTTVNTIRTDVGKNENMLPLAINNQLRSDSKATNICNEDHKKTTVDLNQKPVIENKKTQAKTVINNTSKQMQNSSSERPRRAIKMHKCTLCPKQFLRAFRLKSHLDMHNGIRAFSCNHCTKTYVTKQALKRHLRIHSNERTYKCPQCHKCFWESYLLRGHMKRHTGETRYKCPRCFLGFHCRANLKYHMRIHTGTKPYKCLTCSKCFRLPFSLKLHMETHATESHYTCPKCGIPLKTKYRLKHHLLQYHVLKPNKCLECNKSFATSTMLKIHKRTHTGEKPFCCEHCGKCCSTASALKSHQRTHTGEKPYACPRRYNQSGKLKSHQLSSQAREKAFGCEICGKFFILKWSLKVHMTAHSELKPHECLQCGKGFKCKSRLKLHMRMHTGEKPYTCELCDKAYSQNRSLKKHKETHLVSNKF